jgi:nitrate/nitrite-specific signal transduction histidine kinase
MVEIVATLFALLGVIHSPLSIQMQKMHAIQLELVLSMIWNYWQPTGLYFIVLSTILGTCAGLLVSYTLIRRLQCITQVAKEWSQGEFHSLIHDHIQDELGQLGTYLNNMAEQLQTLLITQRKLAIIEEQARFKRNLYDAVKQRLFAAQMQLSIVQAITQKDAGVSYHHLVETEKLIVSAQQDLTMLIKDHYLPGAGG